MRHSRSLSSELGPHTDATHSRFDILNGLDDLVCIEYRHVTLPSSFQIEPPKWGTLKSRRNASFVQSRQHIFNAARNQHRKTATVDRGDGPVVFGPLPLKNDTHGFRINMNRLSGLGRPMTADELDCFHSRVATVVLSSVSISKSLESQAGII